MPSGSFALRAKIAIYRCHSLNVPAARTLPRPNPHRTNVRLWLGRGKASSHLERLSSAASLRCWRKSRFKRRGKRLNRNGRKNSRRKTSKIFRIVKPAKFINYYHINSFFAIDSDFVLPLRTFAPFLFSLCDENLLTLIFVTPVIQ